MFGREFMIGTNNRPLKETPDVLNSVGMDITPDPFLSTVVDCLMPCIMVGNPLVGRPIIGIDSLGVGGSMSLDKVMKRFPVTATDYLEPKGTATFYGSYYGYLVSLVAVPHILFLTTYKRFVNFYNTIQEFGIMFGHGISYPMAEIPRCFVGDSNSPLDLVSRNTLLGFSHHISCEKPLPQWKVAIVEYSASSNGELIAT